MQGNLKQIQLPEVLQFISMGKSSGLLTITVEPGNSITLVIRTGKIINSSALDRRRRLGELLVHRGILKRTDLSQILALQRTIESDKRLGQILIEREYVDEETVSDVLRLQLEEEIWNLFGLDEGEFKFEAKKQEEVGEAQVQIDIEPLLLEGTRRQDEWRSIVKLIPNDTLVLKVNDVSSELHSDEDLHFSAAEWRVLAQINGKFPISAIVNRSAMGRFEVYRIIADLLNKGIVDFKDFAGEETAQGNAPGKHAESNEASAKSPRMSSIFSRLTGTVKKEGAGEQKKFVTPLGSFSAYINRLIHNFQHSKEYKPEDGDQTLVQRFWNEQLISFTRADLIEINHGQLNVTILERYLDMFEFSELTQDCFEDCIEALSSLLFEIYDNFARRLGEKTASRIAKETLDEFNHQIEHKYGADFSIEERVYSILRINV